MDAALILERRTARRLPASRLGIESARIRPGRPAIVIDASAAGVLVETTGRLLPGSRVEMVLISREALRAARGCIVRCDVAGIDATGMRYRGAIAFEAAVEWFAPSDPGVYELHALEKAGAVSR